MWKKIGHIFSPSANKLWMQSHASTPFPVHMEGDKYRVYFSTRDAQNQSSITYLELMLSDQPHIMSVAEEPVLSPGKAGLFDDSGVTMSQVITHAGQRYLYYQGWNLADKVPFRCSIGLATQANRNANFIKHSDAPILDRSSVDPYSLSYPWVMVEGNKWRMWYGSTLLWEGNGLDVQHVIKYAESDDGVHWQRNDITCIALQAGESGIVRPTIIKENDMYHMWYSIRIGRKETYRLGYATSQDGISWQRRDDEAGLNASINPKDWDSEMICYPCVFTHSQQRYMLYNGNSFGRTGLGLALWAPQA